MKVGRVVKYFVLADFFLLAGWGFIDPIFSVFIVQNVLEAHLKRWVLPREFIGY